MATNPKKLEGPSMATNPKIRELTTLSCSAAWRNYYFVKLVTDDGVVGWSEFDEGFGSPGVGAVIRELAPRLAGQSVMNHERIREDLHCVTRPGSGGVVGQALGAIENALLDAKAKTLGVPCYELLGGKIRDRLRVYWSHCVTWRAARRPHYQPEIGNADGVRALAREVPRFGTPFLPALNIEREIVRGLRDHLQIIREAAGPEMDVLLDLNFNAKTEGYLKILRGIADFDMFWVEIDTLNPHALAWIRSPEPAPDRLLRNADRGAAVPAVFARAGGGRCDRGHPVERSVAVDENRGRGRGARSERRLPQFLRPPVHDDERALLRCGAEPADHGSRHRSHRLGPRALHSPARIRRRPPRAA